MSVGSTLFDRNIILFNDSNRFEQKIKTPRPGLEPGCLFRPTFPGLCTTLMRSGQILSWIIGI